MRTRMSRRLAILASAAALSTGCIPWTRRDEGRRMQQEIEALRADLARARQQDLAALDERVRQLDAALDKATLVLERNSADLGLTVEKVQGKLGQLEGRLADVAQAQAAMAQKAQSDRAAADARLQQLQATIAAAQPPPIPDAPDAAFAEGEKRFAAKQWKDARRLLQAFADRWPKDARAPKAEFLVAEAFAADRLWANAVAAYTRVVEGWPGSDSEEEAMYRCGRAFAELGYCGDARVWLQELLRRHPTTSLRREAKEELDRLARERGNKAVCTS